MAPLIFLFLLLISQCLCSSKTFRVNITNGQIEGRELTASYSIFGNQTGIVFLGIPHLEPPVGNLRFRKPVKNEKTWNGILETKELKAACMSDPVETYKRPEGGPTSEDCLYINVYTNEYCLQYKNCSVMIAIHGGQMTKENPATYHSDIIINNFVGQDRNIVVVTLPYRLGVFGLPNWPGDLDGIADKNLILYDCIAGLEWAHREVSNFGGLPNKTTLFGHSGGAFIGTILSFRSEFDHLYQQRVAMSMPTTFHSELANFKFFRRVAALVGCNTSLPAEHVFSCLRNVSAAELFAMQDRTFHMEPEYISDFAVDGKLILDNPRRLLERGGYSKKPLLIGTVPYEMLFSQYLLDENGDVRVDELREICGIFGFTGAFDNPYGFVDKCVEFYGNKSRAKFLMDDIMFQVPPALLAKHHASEQPVYLYKNTYSAGPAYADFVPNAPGPVHSEDFIYFMGVHRSIANFTEKDMKIERILTGALAAFVNFGEPRLPKNFPKWEKTDAKEMNYFEINFTEKENLEMPGMQTGFYTQETQFWTEDVPIAGGNFSFSTEYPTHCDVFSAHVFSEMKCSVEVAGWKMDKLADVAKENVDEVVEFLREKKREFDEAAERNIAGNWDFSIIMILIVFIFP